MVEKKKLVKKNAVAQVRECALDIYTSNKAAKGGKIYHRHIPLTIRAPSFLGQQPTRFSISLAVFSPSTLAVITSASFVGHHYYSA